VREEHQRVDPLGFAIPREEFFIEKYVQLGVDACYGMPLGLLDGAGDGFVVEMLVDVAAIAGDPRIRVSSCRCICRGVKGSE
jgi:hypothetical protein